MHKEIELKLTSPPAFADFLSKELANFRILEQDSQFLSNCYYDTEDGFFAQQHMGLRVRGVNQAFCLTLKTKGQAHGGLHIRPEYEISLPNAEPDLTQLAQYLSQAEPPNPELAQIHWQSLQLQSLFRTDFCRQRWLVDLAGCEIEVALDTGEIVAETGGKEAICEVEFELKQGNIEDLLRFVSQLTFTDGVRLSSASKAARGYYLAQISQPKTQNWLERWGEFLASAQNAAPQSILTALLTLEQQLIEETLYLNRFAPQALSGDFITTVERIGAFFNLYHYAHAQGKVFAQALEQQKTRGKSCFDQAMLNELLDANQFLYQQIKQIIQRHSEDQHNPQAIRSLVEMLHLGLYTKRLLYFIWLSLAGSEE